MTKETKSFNLLTVPKEKIWFVINTFFTIMYLCWRIFFTIPVEYGVISTVAGLALLIVEVFGMAEAMVHYANVINGNMITGTKAPVILTSRSDSVEVKVNSLALGAVVAEKMKNKEN